MIIEKYKKRFGALFIPDGGQPVHSYRDLGLFPDADSWPEFPAAEPKTEQTPIPGTNGVLDRSEALTGYLTFKNRRGTLVYTLDDPAMWESVSTRVRRLLHGKTGRIIRDADPAYYYYGRITVPTLKADRVKGTITITGDLEPYKYEITDTAEPWLWDSFSFTNGVVRTIYTGIGTRDVDVRGTDEVLDEHGDPVYLLTDVPYNMGGGAAIVLNDETKTVTLWSSPMGGTMTVTVTGDITVTACGVTMELSAASETRAELYDIELPHDVEAVPVTLSGTGSILIEYRAGYL